MLSARAPLAPRAQAATRTRRSFALGPARLGPPDDDVDVGSVTARRPRYTTLVSDPAATTRRGLPQRNKRRDYAAPFRGLIQSGAGPDSCSRLCLLHNLLFQLIGWLDFFNGGYYFRWRMTLKMKCMWP